MLQKSLKWRDGVADNGSGGILMSMATMIVGGIVIISTVPVVLSFISNMAKLKKIQKQKN
jgi:hypothetical protein